MNSNGFPDFYYGGGGGAVWRPVVRQLGPSYNSSSVYYTNSRPPLPVKTDDPQLIVPTVEPIYRLQTHPVLLSYPTTTTISTPATGVPVHVVRKKPPPTTSYIIELTLAIVVIFIFGNCLCGGIALLLTYAGRMAHKEGDDRVSRCYSISSYIVSFVGITASIITLVVLLILYLT